jgi:hypothetical protein
MAINPSNQEKRGRPYERLVAAVQRKLDAGSEVHSSLPLIGKSGSRITLDAAVRGTLGSAKLLIALETKDYAEAVGVEKVRAFATVLEDINAARGIMVAPLGFTRDALLTAADPRFRIETCVLRTAKDQDWEGFNRSLQMTITMMADLYLDGQIVLADGRTIAVNDGGIHIMSDDEGKHVFFDYCVNGALAQRPDLKEKLISIRPEKPLWEVSDDGERVAVVELRCRRVCVPGHTQTFIHTAPEDWVFAKLTPEGALDERHFFEFSELERIAEQFRHQPKT